MDTVYGRKAKEVLVDSAPDYEDICDGEQRKYDHLDCDAGQDTKQRLYVKNVDGAYLWHCHHCSMSGYYRPREYVAAIKKAERVVFEKDPKYFGTTFEAIPTKPLSEFDLRGKLWLNRYGFNEDMVNWYSIKEMPHGVVVPIYIGTNVVGFQVRNYTTTPKYKTYTSSSYAAMHQYSVDAADVYVVVEDLLSMYKLHKAGHNALCLLGTSMSDDVIGYLKRMCTTRLVLWLDDDEAGHAATLKLYRELSPSFKHVTSINMLQPKEVSLDALREMEL